MSLTSKTITLAFLLSLVPLPASAQTPVQPVSASTSDADLDHGILFWEDMRHKIEDLRQLLARPSCSAAPCDSCRATPRFPAPAAN